MYISMHRGWRPWNRQRQYPGKNDSTNRLHSKESTIYNTLTPGDTYRPCLCVCKSGPIMGSGLQVMAFRLFGTKPLPKHIGRWTLKNKLQWNLNHNIFTQWNAIEQLYRNVVCKMSVILSQSRLINPPMQNIAKLGPPRMDGSSGFQHASRYGDQ